MFRTPERIERQAPTWNTHEAQSATGVLKAEAGLSLRDLNRLFLPRGFYEPVAPGTQFDDRLNQVDFRVTKTVRVNRFRIRGTADVYNLLNASNVINMNVTYGPSWKDAIQILSGRLLRVGAQFDF